MQYDIVKIHKLLSDSDRLEEQKKSAVKLFEKELLWIIVIAVLLSDAHDSIGYIALFGLVFILAKSFWKEREIQKKHNSLLTNLKEKHGIDYSFGRFVFVREFDSVVNRKYLPKYLDGMMDLQRIKGNN